MRISKNFFPEVEAISFLDQMFNVWPKKIAHRIFWQGFQALEKSGLTYYETEEEEILVRERIRMIGVIYYEFCHQSAAHESENFSYWSPELGEHIRKEFNEHTDDRIWEVRKALIEYMDAGDYDGEKVIQEMWLNCEEGKNNIILPHDILSRTNPEDDLNYKDARTWWIGGNMSVDTLEGF